MLSRAGKPSGSFMPLLNRLNTKHLEALHLVLELGSLVIIGIGAGQAIAYLRGRQTATRQDALVTFGGMRIAAPQPEVAVLQPAARQAA